MKREFGWAAIPFTNLVTKNLLLKVLQKWSGRYEAKKVKHDFWNDWCFILSKAIKTECRQKKIWGNSFRVMSLKMLAPVIQSRRFFSRFLKKWFCWSIIYMPQNQPIVNVKFIGLNKLTELCSYHYDPVLEHYNVSLSLLFGKINIFEGFSN